MEFNADFWNQKYKSNDIGWDLKSPSTPLVEYIDQLKDKNIKILIPGCGNAYEAEYLLEKGFTNITLIDIAENIVEILKEKFNNRSEISIINQDFFDLHDHYDLVFEQTFFCALDPSLRNKYVNKMHEILLPEGKLVGLLFNKEFNKNTPPFGGTLQEYMSIFSDKFEIITLEECYNSIKPRKGNELFLQMKPIKEY